MLVSQEYRDWLTNLKQSIRQRQIKASVSANRELLLMYWELGRDIVDKQKNFKWGEGFLKQLSRDLKEEFPEMQGWSERNLRRIRLWYETYSQLFLIRTQAVSKLEGEEPMPLDNQSDIVMPMSTIDNVNSFWQDTFFSVPWGHHIVIMQKCKDMNTAFFYINETVEYNWSRAALEWQIESKLFERQGKSITNFTRTLPLPQSDLAQQITKDPYIVDIMEIRQEMSEREIEAYLNSHISQFLLELGHGFTYYGRQVHLRVNEDDFYIDQLFYHVKLHCYVVVELKAVKFKPEHIGQLNFYVSAVDAQLKSNLDNPTIGLLICKDKNDVVAEYSLNNVAAPIGVSSMKIYNNLMEEYKSALPSIEEIEESLKHYDDKE